MHTRELKKPDGRSMTLYSREAIEGIAFAPSPNEFPIHAQPQFRWHALREEWVSYASHRQSRTFLPPPEYNPLAPMTNPKIPTEMPVGKYDAAVFQNLFPALSLESVIAKDASLYVPTEPARGACEVVVFTQDSNTSFGKLPLAQIELILQVWGDRTRRLQASPEIKFVMPFENRGIEMGVTLHHPHGQIYAYPFVPPVAEKQFRVQERYFQKYGKSLLEATVEEEEKDGRRVVYSGDSAICFVPACARYPYEVWVMPKKSVRLISELSQPEITDLARALKTTLLKYDGLWQRPFPYLMVLYQSPVNQPDGEYSGAHLHFEFYPALRTPDRLKYLAGTEIGAGMFANDTVPEDKAKELKQVNVDIES